MIKTVVKSDGTVVPFNPEKLNQKGSWADVDGELWPTIVLDAVSKLQEGCKTSDIDKALIAACTDQFTTASFKLGGRIFMGTIYKEAYGSFKNIPSLKEHMENMIEQGYWATMDYTDEELEIFNDALQHERDLSLNYSEVKQLKDKYLMQDRVRQITLESPQMMYIGMAMANMENQPKDRRVRDVLKLYEYLSRKAINAPTPFMAFLRTPHKNYASCCVATCEDTIPSLSAADHIYYNMTAASAGIGAHLKTRSAGDPVRAGTVEHQGKWGYINAVSAMVKANLQGGRGGAATMHIHALDPEIEMMLKLSNIKTPQERRIMLQFSFGYTRLLAKKVKNKEQWMLISYLYAPDLWEASYGDDLDVFEKLYAKYEASDLPKRFVSAYDLVLESLVQGVESGRVYQHDTQEMNRHTPFKDKIYSSNLCVAPETPILTDKGYVEIATKVGEKVNVWNGEEFSEVEVAKTGENQELVKVVTDSGHVLSCTKYHKFYIHDEDGEVIEVEAQSLKSGDKLIDPNLPTIEGTEEFANAFEEGSKAGILTRYEFPSATHTLSSRMDWLSGYFSSFGLVEQNEEGFDTLLATHGDSAFIRQIQLLLQTVGVESKVSLAYNRQLQTTCKEHNHDITDCCGGENWLLTVPAFASKKLYDLGLKLDQDFDHEKSKGISDKYFVHIKKVEHTGRISDTFCFTEPKRNMGMFAGILTGQCQEIALPTRGYDKVTDLYVEGETSGEIGLCNLAAYVAGRVSDEEIPEVLYYTLLMVDNVISLMEYPFPNLAHTARARRSVGIGITNLAHDMAARGYKYSSKEGKRYIHRVMETHSYYLHKASLQLAKEKGVADWIDRTKYPEGWLPIDTYNKNVDKVVDQELIHDWESLRKEIIEFGGIRNSVLEAFMPNESSSIATNGTNSILPIRSLKIVKTNAGKTTKFIVPDAEELADAYEIAWQIPAKDLVDMYAIVQKFCGQAISADLYLDQTHGNTPSSQLMSIWMRMVMLGIKTRYYINTKTPSGSKQETVEDPQVEQVEDEKGCGSGACTL